jgi:hypothetical protein
MLVLLGVPWMFSAFSAVDSTGNANVQTIEAIFNVRIPGHYFIELFIHLTDIVVIGLLVSLATVRC